MIQIDPVSDPVGRGFESLRARHPLFLRTLSAILIIHMSATVDVSDLITFFGALFVGLEILWIR